ncbi:penicillin-binding transpeptidase domain-containing protein [Streptomyces ipomoeae]|uniref:Penicillin-binding protein, transpeptidase domain protein n=1 Tax=Streptomyces ipomoeae 91-03 TaxID=698759 RepID=L1KLP3_9ACTN|nr:penicillin-binding transpeptidase domain-containing protein [Streptomyces ipomoeae]EKX61527.1 penicillin-binding protein, transpeptidase domain protein [Streptomyces ipomoeae 91-03]MDX2699473.1 penicillin-binding transpeptidase domain-containing protein [Streptomyces ipomoeae]MDX2826756.1 penicillin-binding transpeptidase domain-containing protein [Streptomyces ipomoeae]MDX2843643.1 penicillin-binding transpeptidase domain-containing protein [Streptomyces ipomoeae]MDX2879288.1 penicillin-bi
MGKRRRVDERKAAKSTRSRRQIVLGGVAVMALGGGAFAVYTVFGGGAAAEDGSASSADGKAVKTGPLSATEVRTAATTFLTAWQKGSVAKAAAATDDATAAKTALTGFTKDAHIKDVTLTPGKRTGDKFAFSVKGTVSYKGTSKPLTYKSSLTVVRAEKDGEPVVGWQPSVVHPDLGEGDRLVTGEAGTPPVKALDRDGGELTAKKYPSLGTVLDGLREKYGEKAGGKAGVELRVVRAKPEQSGKSEEKEQKEQKEQKAADKTLLELSKGTPGELKTTLSPSLQAAAEEQVATTKRASVVVMRPSTGEILAVANSGHGFNVAFQGSLAPGSTMKIVSSALLIDKGLASADKVHPCPKYASYGGWKFQNDDKFQINGGTFKASFARSCNTAFISQAKKLDDNSLTLEAQQVFGLGMNNWAIGVSSFDGAVPVQSDAPMAASLIGQGGVRMNPLNMASVVSTAKTGVFKQPYLVSPSVDGRTLATASRPMSDTVRSQLRELLQYTAAAGTAAEAMAGLGPDYGAKTGSAEVDGQKQPNGWFTAWKGDLASAGVVQQGGHGSESAGPIVAALLKAGSS